MFYLKLGACGIWFLVVSAYIFVLSLVYWRNPFLPHRWARSFAWGVEKILGIDVVVEGKEILKMPPPFIAVGNHQSMLDIFIHGKSVPSRCVGIGKVELIWVPIFGQLFYMTGNIFINRRNKLKAAIALDEALDHIVKEKVSIYMFPEGTRNQSSPELLPFKKGAFSMAIKAQVPIIPVVASRFNDVADFKNKKFRKGTVHIKVLDPIPTVGLTDQDVAPLADRVYAQMQNTYSQLQTVVRE